MGNTPTCVDCDTTVPLKVRFLDKLPFEECGRRFSKWAFGDVWILIGPNKYLCARCLEIRPSQERNEERRKEELRCKEEEQLSKHERQKLEQQRELQWKKHEYENSEIRLQTWRNRERDKIHEKNIIAFKDVEQPSFISYLLKVFSSGSEITQDKVMKCESTKSDESVTEELITRGNLDAAVASEIKTVVTTVRDKIKEYEQNKITSKCYDFSNPYHHLLSVVPRRQIPFFETSDEFSKCMFKICVAVQVTKKYWPRNTQIISLCLLIKHVENGILLEINTGEGKTCITAMFSAFLALSGVSVDVVSSSPILALRDCEEWKEFYKALNISVSCNLIPTTNVKRLECYSHRVVYGTVGSFASDILRQNFLMEEVRGTRKCEAVIVDEVDCMLLDQGVHFTYLSNTVPGMHHIEPILFIIWNKVKKYPKIKSESSEIFFLGDLQPIHVLLANVIDKFQDMDNKTIPIDILRLLLCFSKDGSLPDNSFEDVYEEEKFNTDIFKNIFSMSKILDCLHFVETLFPVTFKPYTIVNERTIKPLKWRESNDFNIHIDVLVVGEGLLTLLYDDKESLYSYIKSEIEKHICFEGRNENAHEIPKYLEQFVMNRLPSWIANAFTAKDMSEGREYLLSDQNVIPVDYEATGVVQHDTKWGDCLHQFLEIKHGKKLSQITLVTNFMSNQELFNKYNGRIYGVSGTLGNDQEKSFLQRRFNLQSQKIPTHRNKRFIEITGQICNGKEEWQRMIVDIVHEQTLHNKRAVLLVCEDIKTSEDMKDQLVSSNCKAVTLYTRNDENNDKMERKIKGGEVIVATNIAGRGTDIEIGLSVEKAGGLFVLVSFLPQNTRIENQVFGRSARKGKPGAAQIVINSETLPFCFKHCKEMNALKRLRDDIEKQRIIDIERNEFERIRFKETLFEIYCEFLKTLTALPLNEVNKTVMLDSLHEYWGIWLKMNFDNAKFSKDVLTKRLKSALIDAGQKITAQVSPNNNIYHIIKFANQELQNRNFEESKLLFTQAIKTDKSWAAFAFYNRAYCSLRTRNNGYIESAISDLQMAENGLELFKQEMIICLTLAGNRYTDNGSEESCALVSQYNTRCQLIQYFTENIKTSVNQLETLKREKKDVTVETSSIFTIAVGDEHSCKRLESELYIFWELGLTDIIMVKEKKLFSWKGLLVAALGVLQIAVGFVLIAGTTGVLTQLGWGLIAEGINDICTGVYAIYKSDQNFVKSWMSGKAVSIAISIATFGFTQVIRAVRGVQGVQEMVKAVANNFNEGARAVFSKIKNIPERIASNCGRSLFKETCVFVGKEVGTKLAMTGGKYLFEVAQQKIKQHFEDEARKRLNDEISLLFVRGKFRGIIVCFILYHNRFSNEMKTPELICKKYMQITKKLIGVDNIKTFRQVLIGCVKDVLHTARSKLDPKDSDNCKPIFDIINNISTSSDINDLVKIYSDHVTTALNEIYPSSCLTSQYNDDTELQENEKALIDATVKIMIDETSNYLCEFLNQSFELTGSGVMADKLQNSVGKIVSEYIEDSNEGNETTVKILSITSKACNIRPGLINDGKVDISTAE